MKNRFIHIAMYHPKSIMFAIAAITAVIVFFAYQRILNDPHNVIDTDPENMLNKNEHVRQFHQSVKERFELFDVVAMGVYHPGKSGVFTKEILSAVNSISNEILELEYNNFVIDKNGDTIRVDLAYETILEKVEKGKRIKEVNKKQGIIFKDIIAPNQVEDINGSSGSLVIKTLMASSPVSDIEARKIKERIDLNPLYRDKMASEDGKIIGIYIPIKSKTISYNLAEVLKILAEKHLSGVTVGNDTFFGSGEEKRGEYIIAGIPVAQDTFGIFMFDQMGVSAPLAGLVIFILLFVFFRHVKVITAPMILAIVSISWTMGLLIAMGFTLHIMSSMIPIFLFPIAVLDSIHVISSIHKKFGQGRNLHKSIEMTVKELFSPMLFTSLTTVVGFVSLLLTPIPPVQVFGTFVAVGVASAWLLSITFLPAYINMLGEKTLDNFGHTKDSEHGFIGKVGQKLEWLSQNYHKSIISLSLFLFLVAVYGISKIEINDNPVNWFKNGHPVRHASELMNKHVSGTYMSNIVFELDKTASPEGKHFDLNKVNLSTAKSLFANSKEKIIWGLLENGDKFQARLDADGLLDKYIQNIDKNYAVKKIRNFDEDRYEEMDFADYYRLEKEKQVNKLSFYKKDGLIIFNFENNRYFTVPDDDQLASLKFNEYLNHYSIADQYERFKSPEILRYMESVQKIAEGDKSVVGSTSSVLDIVKKVSMELRQGNKEYYKLPDSKNEVGQYIFLAQGGESPEDIFKFITRNFDSAHLWLHLNSGDNKNMEAVINRVNDFIKENPLPQGIQMEWAGLNYINKVWQDKMVGGMADSLSSSYIVVFLMVSLLFRSVRWGMIAMIPITLTVALIYALIGYLGKAYDMPIAVLSSLTLGLSIDFGIHYIGRARDIHKQTGNYLKTIKEVFGEPATAMLQNTIVISIGFIPLLFSDLVPYLTVGAFFLLIMFISGFATLLILPAISKFANKRLFPVLQE